MCLRLRLSFAVVMFFFRVLFWGVLGVNTRNNGAAGRGLPSEDAVVVFARSCGSVCDKPPLHTSYRSASSPYRRKWPQ